MLVGCQGVIASRLAPTGLVVFADFFDDRNYGGSQPAGDEGAPFNIDVGCQALSSADLGEIPRLQAMQGNFLLGIGTHFCSNCRAKRGCELLIGVAYAKCWSAVRAPSLAGQLPQKSKAAYTEALHHSTG